MPYNLVRLGGETRINTSTAGTQGSSTWFELLDGRFVMQWMGNGTVPGQEDTNGLFQQIFDMNGQRIGGEIRVNATTDGGIDEYRSMTLAGGRWGAIWRVTEQEPGTGSDFYLRAFAADGAPGQEIRLNETAGGATGSWNNVFLRNGNSVLVWSGSSTKAGQEDDQGVFFRIVDANGNAVGGETRVNGAVDGRNEIFVSGTGLTDGGWVVTYRSATDSSLAWQQAFNPDGTKRGGEVQLTSDESALSTLPNIRNLADGKWMTLWYEGANTLDRDLYYQIFNADGSPGDKALVTTSTEGDQMRLATQTLVNGGFVTYWRGKGTQAGQEDDNGIFYQRFDAHGVKVGGETRLNATADGDQTFSASFLTYKPNADSSRYIVDRYVTMWKGNGNQPGQADDSGLFLQLIDGTTGEKVGSETRVATSTEGSAPSNYGFAWLEGSDRFVVTWSGKGTQPGQEDDAGVFVQMFDRNGTKIGTETRVNTTTAGEQQFPVVKALSNGSWAVMWQGPDAGGDVGVYMQLFDPNGNRVGGEILVNTSTAGPQYPTYLDTLADGSLFVGWDGAGDQPGQEDIYDEALEEWGGLFFQRFKVNASPESIALSGSIREDAVAGGTAGTLSAFDRDRNDTHTFTLVDAADRPTSHALFELSGSVIKLKAGAKLDYETTSSYSLRVKVEDGFGGSHVQDVTVSVTNALEKTPLKKNGTSGNDVLRGELGNDTLQGGSGDDRFHGDLGRDRIVTGSGRDIVVFDTRPASANRDTITDFDPRKDAVYLDNEIFKKLGKKGSLEKPAKISSTFIEFGPPNDANDYLLYNRKTGILSYDADGNKAGKAIEIAIFTNKPKLTTADFFMI